MQKIDLKKNAATKSGDDYIESWFMVCFANELHFNSVLMILKNILVYWKTIFAFYFFLFAFLLNDFVFHLSCSSFKGRQWQTMRRLFNQIDCCYMYFFLIRWQWPINFHRTHSEKLCFVRNQLWQVYVVLFLFFAYFFV